MPVSTPDSSSSSQGGSQVFATSRRTLVKGAAWTAPALVVVPAARAYASSPVATGVLGSICTGAMVLGADTIEATVAFGILIPDGATVPAGTTFTFSVQASAGGAPTALPVSGLSTTVSVTPSGGAYIYTVTVAAPYTNSSGSEVFFAGGVAWTGANALPIGTEISTSESGAVTVDSGDTCYYNAY